MKCYVIPSPKGIDALTLVERPEPTPGPRQVLVRVRATSLNYRDLITVEGNYARAAPKPDLIPLSDGAGEVVSVGPGVTRVKVGDRVAGCFMQRWVGGAIDDAAFGSAMGGAIDGMLTELAVLEEDGVVRLPQGLSFEEGATLPCAAVTAWHALVEIGGIKAGDTVLVLGSGGVSIFALQFARLLGARVIATSSSDAKLARARELGAAEGINYRDVPDWGVRAKELAGGEGVDHVVEVGGAETLAQSLRAVRFGGTISLIGNLTGTTTQVVLTQVFMQNVRLQGILVGHRESVEAMNRAIALHGLRPVIDRAFPFEEAPAAFAHLAAGGHFGKIVVRS
jgi:NADPH:quinone reductase-like Zn-dependent oxidoreductase